MSTEVNVLIPEDTASCCGPSCCDDTAAEAAAPAVEARAETPLTAAAIKATVREKYAQIAVGAASSCCDSSVCCTDDISMIGDAYDTVEGYVAEADLGLGCGLPTEYANLQPGQTVLDLGAGAGLDAFVARRIVGEQGRVLGLDMTQEMVDKARANVRTLGYDNVDFYLGDIEAMPFDEGTVDGDSLTWKASITSPMAMTLEFSATVDDDEMSGDVKLGAFGNATFTGTRA